MYSVVIIDDNRLSADTLASLSVWKEMDCCVIDICYDGFSGKDSILEKKPDIIIADIQMPGLNGIDLFSAIKQYLPNTKVIYISAYNDFEYAQKAIRVGASDYLLKPFSMDSLRQAIERTVGNASKDEGIGRIGAGQDSLDEVKAYISAHLDSSCTIEDVAEAFHISPSTFERYLLRRTGLGFRDLKTNIRMERAKVLIMDVRNSMDDVARMIGYKSYQSFYRAFIKETGLSPLGYREQEIQKMTKED